MKITRYCGDDAFDFHGSDRNYIPSAKVFTVVASYNRLKSVTFETDNVRSGNTFFGFFRKIQLERPYYPIYERLTRTFTLRRYR